jgi:cobalt/nickel transport system ATP-binding protein
MSVFSLRNVMYSYANGEAVLNDLTLDFQPGERTVILGANGTGKSTLLCMLDGLVFPRSGSIHAFKKPLSEASLEDRFFSMDFRRRVAFVFQNPDVQLSRPRSGMILHSVRCNLDIQHRKLKEPWRGCSRCCA